LKTEIDPNDPAQVALVERIKDFYPYGGKTSRFIDWAARVRPARRYILVLSDHGDGYLPTEEIVTLASPNLPCTRK
jgi:hypothetical protein